jgi:hypothetical protein
VIKEKKENKKQILNKEEKKDKKVPTNHIYL